MNWIALTSDAQLNEIDQLSQSKKIFIFKHSTTCSISHAALNRLERNWKDSDNQLITTYYLDLLRYRNLSNEVARKYNIVHESPQLLFIENGKCSYNSAHFEINYADLMKEIS